MYIGWTEQNAVGRNVAGSNVTAKLTESLRMECSLYDWEWPVLLCSEICKGVCWNPRIHLWILVWIPTPWFNLWIPTTGIGQFWIPVRVQFFDSTSRAIFGFRLWCNFWISSLLQALDFTSNTISEFHFKGNLWIQPLLHPLDSASCAILGFRLWCNLRILPLEQS